MLKVENIDVYYGKVQALYDVCFEVGENEIVSIIGSNGAGKSTLMKTIMGVNKPAKGTIEFNGEQIGSVKTNLIVGKRLVYIPEGREVFPKMSVKDNLVMGAYSRKYSSAEMNRKLEEMFEIYPRLKERQSQLAGSMSGGEQQMLAIARGLMSEPKMVMYDEPSLGLSPLIVDEMFETIVKVKQTMKIPVVIVEQNAFMAMSISDRTYILENGHMKGSGASKELMDSPEIKKAYLGG
ncbi:ABC transporter ATP-binding protein [Anaerobium acetethylicum]|uniref:Branched-chain amino acid transport system ATP-binding protein n=1 Tax=Anaerobium acetethylicum TaxID=1619234 RepID=A0A1D3TYP0_9FIRM|nr:ABC transporter ATP-binding protein [Anaerobium acetethylicum]SCP99597.1 branched-chain amino acid transport system ATP-binding protein [Anaerobium acetethylicum]